VPFCYVWTDDLNVEKCLLDKIFHTLVTSQEILARILEYVEGSLIVTYMPSVTEMKGKAEFPPNGILEL